MTNPPGRPSKLTDFSRGVVLRGLAHGFRVMDVAQIVGVHVSSIGHWRRLDPNFDVEVRHAIAVARSSEAATRFARKLHAHDTVTNNPLATESEMEEAFAVAFEGQDGVELARAMDDQIRRMSKDDQNELLDRMETLLIANYNPEMLERLHMLREELAG